MSTVISQKLALILSMENEGVIKNLTRHRNAGNPDSKGGLQTRKLNACPDVLPFPLHLLLFNLQFKEYEIKCLLRV